MRVLLVQPSERPIIGKRKEHGSIMPPLSILTLAAVVRDQFPIVDVRVADFEATNGEPDPDFSSYDLIGITGTTVHVPHIAQLARQARTSNAEACIVVGGPHASFCDRELLETVPEIDVVVRGEGEIAFSELVRQYRGRYNLPSAPGLSTRKRRSSQLAPIVPSLDDLPTAAYDLVRLSKYQLSTHRKVLPIPFASLMTTRGCPFSCTYCQTPQMFGSAIRYRAPALVRSEIETLISTAGIRSVVFWDDTFTVNRKHTLALCAAIKPLQLQWMCNTRVECVDRNLLRAMYEAGCRVVFYGVESAQEDTLQRLGRTTRPMLRTIREAFATTHDVGIATVGTLMIGAPGDTLPIIQENIDFLKGLRPTYVYISIYNVTPGAAEFQGARDAGHIRDHIDWTNPEEFVGPPFGLPTAHPVLKRGQLQEFQKSAYHACGFGEEYE
jgi:radical SAM superfamily enzyme YgiQ (UPF0313 family)